MNPGQSSKTWTADNGNGTFTNPLFFDEFSDPDMIRVGDDYYLTGTTMHTMPGLPILHSKDLVNWNFVCYVVDRLDFGPEFRLENGQEMYGQGIWAPCFRYHSGTFYIFSNTRGVPLLVYRATDPAGPWTCTEMKRRFHDASVLFDDDGKVYIVYDYRAIKFAQLNDDLTDIVPGTEQTIIPPEAGMGEGCHFYKIEGKYYILSAWYMGTMRMPCARADRPEGPYEVLHAISEGEDFGIATGAIHQGGIVDTASGEWWGYSMMDYNSVGRLTALSPITWKEGWPYFGLPGNLGRSPRTWVKPNTGHTSPPTAPYERSDDFSAPILKPIWQWNHLPDDTKWSLTERPGRLRLHSLPASDFWLVRNSLTQRAIGPESIATTELDTSGMQTEDTAGLALLNSPYAWIGVRRDKNGPYIEHFDSTTGDINRVTFTGGHIWLRVHCDFRREQATFHYSLDGANFEPLGDAFAMVYQLKTFQGVRFALFHYNTGATPGGYADFERVIVDEPWPQGLTQPIPFGQEISLTTAAEEAIVVALPQGPSVVAADSSDAARFEVIDRGLGRVALRSSGRFLSVAPDDRAVWSKAEPTDAETFQWIETPPGDLMLLSLSTNRYLRVDTVTGQIFADSPGPQRGRSTGFQWRRYLPL